MAPADRDSGKILHPLEPSAISANNLTAKLIRFYCSYCTIPGVLVYARQPRFSYVINKNLFKQSTKVKEISGFFSSASRWSSNRLLCLPLIYEKLFPVKEISLEPRFHIRSTLMKEEMIWGRSGCGRIWHVSCNR